MEGEHTRKDVPNFLDLSPVTSLFTLCVQATLLNWVFLEESRHASTSKNLLCPLRIEQWLALTSHLLLTEPSLTATYKIAITFPPYSLGLYLYFLQSIYQSILLSNGPYSCRVSVIALFPFFLHLQINPLFLQKRIYHHLTHVCSEIQWMSKFLSLLKSLVHTIIFLLENFLCSLPSWIRPFISLKWS